MNKYIITVNVNSILVFCQNNWWVLVAIYVFLSYIVYGLLMRRFITSEREYRHDKNGKEINIDRRIEDTCHGEILHTRDYKKLVRQTRQKLYFSPICLPAHVIVKGIKCLCSTVRKMANMTLGVEK